MVRLYFSLVNRLRSKHNNSVFLRRDFQYIRVLLCIFLFSQWSTVFAYECNYYAIDVDKSQGFVVCQTTCVALLGRIPDGVNSLSCPSLHQNNWCNQYCADVKDQCTNVGNPIQLSTGAKIQTETDYINKGLYPLKVERFYSSAPGAPTGNFGEKWTGIANSHIVARSDGFGNGTYTVATANGNYIKFYGPSDISFNGITTAYKSTNTATLTAFNYGFDGYPQIWQLAYKDGREEVFEFDLNAFINTGNYDSKLIWRRHPNGLTHSFTYDTQGRIETITDNFNNQLSFTYYPTTNFIETITVPGNRIYKYEYDSNDNLTHVYYPDDTPGDWSDNPYKQYLYENTSLPNHLTGIIDENGERYATFAYYSNGEAKSTEHAGGAEKVEVLSYGDDVRVANAKGQESVYHFQTVGSGDAMIRRLMGVTGEATSNCIGSDTTRTYDANGFKDLEKDGRDYYTDYDHNSNGYETRRLEALVMDQGSLVETPESRLTETDWINQITSNYTTISVIDEIRVEGKTTNFTYDPDNALMLTRTDTDTTTQTIPYSTNSNTRTTIPITIRENAKLQRGR